MDDQELPPRALGDPCAATDQVLARTARRDADEHALTCLGDPALRPPRQERLVHLVRDAHQRELPERGEVLRGEEPLQRELGLPLVRVDVPVEHPSPERVRRHVDELDLIRHVDDPVRHGLALADARHVGHHIIQALDVLDVHGRDDLDAGMEEVDHVLPALRAAGAGDVRVRELVDQSHLGMALEHARPCPSPRRACRGTRRHAEEPSGALRASRSSSGDRRSRHRRPRPSCRVRRAGGPRRASRTSCRRREPNPSRCGEAPSWRRSRPRVSTPAPPWARGRPRGRPALRPTRSPARAPPRSRRARSSEGAYDQGLAYAVNSSRGFIICSASC